MPASPSASTIRENPPPLVAVIARAPALPAPIAKQIAAISSSVCLTTMSYFLACPAMNSKIELAGVMGYPDMNRHPAAIAPTAMAWLPLICIRSGRSLSGETFQSNLAAYWSRPTL